MFVQIVSYNLNGVSEEDYIEIAHQVAPQFANVDGLLAKVWLGDPQSNSYGAVYFWADRASGEAFQNSNLFEGTYEGFANVVAVGYESYDQLTRATQPLLPILQEEGGWAPPPPPPQEAEVAELEDEAPELDEEPEPELAIEPERELVEEPEEEEVVAPAPVVRATRRVVKKAPRKAAGRAAKVAKGAKKTKVTKTVKAAPGRRAGGTKVTKVTKVTKKVGRPQKVAKVAKRAKKAKRLR